jgi:hypothetical protein
MASLINSQIQDLTQQMDCMSLLKLKYVDTDILYELEDLNTPVCFNDILYHIKTQINTKCSPIPLGFCTRIKQRMIGNKRYIYNWIIKGSIAIYISEIDMSDHLNVSINKSYYYDRSKDIFI